VADELQRKNAAARTLAAAAGLQQGVELEPASRGRRTADRPILLHLPAGSFALLIHGQSGVHELVPNCPSQVWLQTPPCSFVWLVADG
jgi:hypothetical protein